MKRIKRSRVEIIVIILLGLIPLLWFRGTEVILGHDSGLPLSPIPHFLDRLYAWTVRFGFGNDQTYAIPGFFIHGLEALVSSLGFDLQSMQKITFSIWFVLPGVTMYYLGSRLEKKLKINFLSLPAAVFYMINHFLLQGWFVAERTKFSVYAALPLMIAILLDWSDGRRKTFTAAVLIALIFFVLNGLASLPLFGGVIIALIVFIFYYLYQQFSWIRIGSLFQLFGVTLVVSVALHAYWLVPFVFSLKTSYSESVTFFGGKEGILDWVKYASLNSSYNNLLRLQGVPEWYQNPGHPYANNFLTNPLLIFISVAIPICVFSTLLIFKKSAEKKVILFFGLLAIVSLLFVAGAHPPFGTLYIFLMQNIPGFIAFRNPFYKFSPSLWLAYAVLIGFFISFIMSRVVVINKKIAYVFYSFVIIGIVLYSYPFLNGTFFDYVKNERSNRVVVPSYIMDFGKWSESRERIDKKTLMLPPPNIDGTVEEYTWGYWSLAPISTLLTNAPILNNSLFLGKNEKTMLTTLYSMMEKDEQGWEQLAKIMGIDSFVVRDDFVWDNPSSPSVNPAVYQKALTSKNVQKVKEFEKWHIYDLKEGRDDFLQYNTYSFVAGDVGTIGKIASLPGYSYEEPLVADTNGNSLLKMSPNTYYLDSYCVMCDLQWKFINTLAYTPTITQGSFMYPIIGRNVYQEISLLDQPQELAIYYSEKALRDILGLQKSIDLAEKDDVLKEIITDIEEDLFNIRRTVQLSQNEINNVTKLDILSFIRTQKVVISQIKEKNLSSISMDKMLKAIEINESFLNQITFRTSSETKKQLLVTSPIAHEYSVYYRPNDNIEDSNSVSISINNQQLILPVLEEDGRWRKLSEVNLNKGLNTIVVQQPINDIQKQKSVRLVESTNGCYYSEKIDSKRGDIFKLTFDHRLLSSYDKFFVTFVPAGESVDKAPSIDSLTSVKGSRLYETTYAPIAGRSFQFVICNTSIHNDPKHSDIQIENISMRKIAVPDLIFVKQGAQSKSSQPRILERSNTSYTLEGTNVNGSSVLTFSQSYNNNWKSDTYEHFIVNGFSNGWILPSETQKVRVKYKIQDLFIIGVTITSISLVGTLIILIGIYKKRSK